MPAKALKTKKSVPNPKAGIFDAGQSAVAPMLPKSKRDRRLHKTRRQFAEVAVALFEEKGFAATTVEEIANAADYSTGTFFRMFVDKQEVVFYDFGERLEELRAVFASPNHGNVWVAIRGTFIHFASRWDIDEGELGKRRARLFHSEPNLNARYLAKNAEWEREISGLIAAEFRGEPKQLMLCNVIAGAAVAAFRAAWRVQLEEKNVALVDCVKNAFDQLESIGLFFRSPPNAREDATPKRRKKTS